ncbi:hypothetical protein [Chlorella virus XW01]|nr:hypothetical protein [Chlorella virus XW01]
MSYQVNTHSFENLRKRIDVLDQKKLLDSQKKIRYKITPYNIDSKYREKNPKNILEGNTLKIKNNGLTFIENSFEIGIAISSNNNFKVNDRIILEGVLGDDRILNNNIYMFNNFEYAIVYYPNHEITIEYKKIYTELKVFIENQNNVPNYFGNIPSNAIINSHNIVLLREINITDLLIKNISETLLSSLNININDVDNNFFLIKLPFSYISNSFETNVIELDGLFKYTFDNIFGIKTAFINANYPINYIRYIGFHQIERIDRNNIYIKCKNKAYKSGISGGNNIVIGKIKDSIEGFPDASNYSIFLKKNFNNVVRIELISTEIPFVEFIVQENNKLYWKQYDDGNFIYSTSIPPGNYNGSRLIETISDRINNIERIVSTEENKILNLFEIGLNTFTQTVNFTAFKLDNLPNSIRIESAVIFGNNYFLLTVRHLNNLVEVGDIIEIAGSTSIGLVPSSAINKKHRVYSLNKEQSSYSIILEPFIPTNINGLVGDGGVATRVKSRALVSFYFNKKDTLGGILGFKNVGNINSITPFSHITTNKDNYVLPNLYDEVGNIVNNDVYLNLTGDNNYLMMHLNDYESITSNSPEGNCFAKILLAGNPGDILFNTFMTYPVEFDIPIQTINRFDIKFTFSDSSKPRFNNLDHSFTLLITEIQYDHEEIGKNSKDNNFLQSLENKKLLESVTMKY